MVKVAAATRSRKETLEAITSVDSILGMAEFSFEKLRVSPQKVVDAFKAYLTLPVLWFDGTESEARYEAIRDNVNTQRTTVSDKLMIYSEEIDKPGINNMLVAKLLDLSPVAYHEVSQMGYWHET